MEQVSRPPGKGRGRAGPGAPRQPPPPGCSEGGRAVQEGGGEVECKVNRVHSYVYLGKLSYIVSIRPVNN